MAVCEPCGQRRDRGLGPRDSGEVSGALVAGQQRGHSGRHVGQELRAVAAGRDRHGAGQLYRHVLSDEVATAAAGEKPGQNLQHHRAEYV